MANTEKPDNAGKSDTAGRVLLEETNDLYALKIELDPEELECRASIAPKSKGDMLTPDSLGRILRDCGVREGLLPGAIAAFCQLACQGRSQEKVLLAEGTRPEPGPDGHLEFLVRVSSNEIQLNEEDEGGKVDLRNLNFFSNVLPDEPIGRIHPPQNGEPGLTVTGLPVTPLLGKPLAVTAGKGVRLEDEGSKLVAEAPGRVVYEGTTVSVTEEYTVNGDVDYEVGSIDFLGTVDVRGDVLDEFDITATKGITVSGTVGACRLASEGDINLGSMAGKGTGTIKCRGNLTARFLNDVFVECEGNVVVNNEIRNSVIKAGGHILVENGPISGGECIALAGIEAKVVGSYLGVRTKLTSGVYYPEVDRLKYLHERQESVLAQIKRITDTLGPLSRKTSSKTAAGAIKKRIEVLTARLEELNAEKGQIAEELNDFRHEEHPAANAKINVKGSLEESVVICLGKVTEEVRAALSGPLSIIENSIEPSLRFLSLSPLTVKSSDMEVECLQEETAGR